MMRPLINILFLLLTNYFVVYSQIPAFDVKRNNALISLWDFNRPVNGGWSSSSSEDYFLAFGTSKVNQVFDEDLNRRVAEFRDGNWLSIPRDRLKDLNIQGDKATLTVLALVKKQSEKDWQAIAGVWDESRSKRQYYMFLNASSKTHQDEMKRYPSQGRLHGHISSSGGKTPNEVAWISYASSKDPVVSQTWEWIAMTYNGKKIKVFVGGELQKDPQTNPFKYPEGVFDGGNDGAEFTVGANSVSNKMTNQFIGRMAYLAVFNEALTAKEIKKTQERLFSLKSNQR